MSRTFAPGVTPQDVAFAARMKDDADNRKRDAEAWAKAEIKGDILAATTQQKIEHYYAKGQQAANDLGASVLVHFHRIPHHERTPPTLDAVLVPAKEEAAAPPARAAKSPSPPPPPPPEYHPKPAASRMPRR